MKGTNGSKQIAIVFEEIRGPAGDIQSFRVYLTGDVERIGKTNLNELSPAERFAVEGYKRIQHMLKTTAGVEATERVALPDARTHLVLAK